MFIFTVQLHVMQYTV